MDIDTFCPENSFVCKEDKICISSREVCDGITDCFSNEDEKNCSSLTRFQCKSSKLTISAQHVCNLFPDCEDASDELFCSKYYYFINILLHQIKLSFFKKEKEACGNNKTSLRWFEIFFDNKLCNWLNRSWACKGGKCISKDKVCDGEKNCFDESDEICLASESNLCLNFFIYQYNRSILINNFIYSLPKRHTFFLL